MSINLHTLLFLHCTYGYLITNIFAAKIPGLALLFVAIRDSWVFLFFFLIFRHRLKENIILGVFLIILLLIGLAPFIEGNIHFSDFLIYFYGIRDLSFIALIYFYLRNDQIKINQSLIYSFVYAVFILYLTEVFSQIFGFSQVYQDVFGLDSYYASKGVETNLSGGLYGVRPGLPLYSPALVATLLGGFILSDKVFKGRWILYLASVATLSKVLVYFLLLRIFKRFYIGLFVAGILMIPIVIGISNHVKNTYPNTIYSYHAHSISEHLSPLRYVQDGDWSILPDALGSSSILAFVIAGEDSSDAPESLLMSRLLDFNLLAFILLLLLFLSALRLKGEARFIFISFLGLQFLTSLSNHPLTFLPLVLFFNDRSRSGLVIFQR